MKLSIVIPNYNGKKLLQKNLPYVFDAAEYFLKKTNSEVQVIVIDDCSEDNSVESIKYFISSIKQENIELKILENERNLGFSSTVNKGVKEASGEIVVLLNTDVVPEKDFLDPLIIHFKDPKIFAVGCMDKSIEGSNIVLRGRGIGKWQRGFLVHARGEIDKADTLWVNGGSGAFRKSIWERLGGFNELYSPFYWEDIDLSYRALKSGYKVLFEPKSIVVHEHEKGSIKKKYSSFQIKTIAYRNQIIFAWNNISDYGLFFTHIFWLPYYIARAIAFGDLPFLFGLIKALTLLPKIVLSRPRLNKYFTKLDQEVIAGFK